MPIIGIRQSSGAEGDLIVTGYTRLGAREYNFRHVRIYPGATLHIDHLADVRCQGEFELQAGAAAGAYYNENPGLGPAWGGLGGTAIYGDGGGGGGGGGSNGAVGAPGGGGAGLGAGGGGGGQVVTGDYMSGHPIDSPPRWEMAGGRGGDGGQGEGSPWDLGPAIHGSPAPGGGTEFGNGHVWYCQDLYFPANSWVGINGVVGFYCRGTVYLQSCTFYGQGPRGSPTTPTDTNIHSDPSVDGNSRGYRGQGQFGGAGGLDAYNDNGGAEGAGGGGSGGDGGTGVTGSNNPFHAIPLGGGHQSPGNFPAVAGAGGGGGGGEWAGTRGAGGFGGGGAAGLYIFCERIVGYGNFLFSGQNAGNGGTVRDRGCTGPGGGGAGGHLFFRALRWEASGNYDVIGGGGGSGTQTENGNRHSGGGGGGGGGIVRRERIGDWVNPGASVNGGNGGTNGKPNSGIAQPGGTGVHSVVGVGGVRVGAGSGGLGGGAIRIQAQRMIINGNLGAGGAGGSGGGSSNGAGGGGGGGGGGGAMLLFTERLEGSGLIYCPGGPGGGGGGGAYGWHGAAGGGGGTGRVRLGYVSSGFVGSAQNVVMTTRLTPTIRPLYIS
jgi:hypothetical protein